MGEEYLGRGNRIGGEVHPIFVPAIRAITKTIVIPTVNITVKM